MISALQAVKQRLRGPALDEPTQRYVEFNRGRWHQDWPVRDGAVVLAGMSPGKPLIHCYTYALNHLARELGAEIESFSFLDRRDPALEKIYESFGAPIGLSLEDARPFRGQAREQADRIFANLQTKWDVVRISVDGVALGELIYDTYLRHFARATVDLRDENLRTMIYDALLIFHACRAYLARKQPAAVIVDHLVYHYSGILVRLATLARIPVLLTYYAPRFFLFQVNNALSDPATQVPLRWPYWKYREIFAQLDPADRAAALAKGREALQNRLAGKADGVLRGQSAYAEGGPARLLAETGRPRVLVLLHDFCDAVHVFREFLFPDFYEWIHFVLRHSEQTEFDWYVKPHPNNNERSRAAMNASNKAAVEKLQRTFPRVRFLDPSASNKQLVAEGISAMFTGRGTAGHEFAALGVPVVNAGDNPHIDYPFNLHPATLDDFEQCIYKADRLEAAIDPRAIEEFFYMNYFHFHDRLGAAGRPFEPELASGPEAGKSEVFDRFIAGTTPERDEAMALYFQQFVGTIVPPQARRLLPATAPTT
ncbi:MAG: hypothetical protein QOE70_3695 [Chthoniobacter sp.]|nr:hypothetical protein [Chthoniobacter sp.]